MRTQATDLGTKARYGELVSLVRERGTAFRKDHGQWIQLWLTADLFMQLDTWNSQVTLMRGPGTYRGPHSRPFDGETLEAVGIDFGSFACYVSRSRLEALIRVVGSAPRQGSQAA